MSKANLLKAIDKAEMFGGCDYLHDDKTACCVIAQLYVLEGGDPKDMDEWDNSQVDDIQITHDPEELKKYDLRLLCSIQAVWDNSPQIRKSKDANEARQRMKQLVIKHYKDSE